MWKERNEEENIDSDKRHDQLWKVCKYKGAYLKHGGPGRFGKSDCSCGCKYFHELEGDNGMDWGVCFNPKSPRAGLLTFEHMGCKYFKLKEGEK